eukprot:XP_028350300.1 neuroepithelial cell-transforming gene 1 protein-like isoform X2 [Physeter catodon]
MESELAAQEQSRPRRRSRRASGLSAGGAAEPSADTPGPGPDGSFSLWSKQNFSTFLQNKPAIFDYSLKATKWTLLQSLHISVCVL